MGISPTVFLHKKKITKSTTQVIELPGLIIETVIALIPKKDIFHFPSRFQTYKLVHIIYI